MKRYAKALIASSLAGIVVILLVTFTVFFVNSISTTPNNNDNSSDTTTSEDNALPKLVQDATFHLETECFDTMITTLENTTDKCDGYYEKYTLTNDGSKISMIIHIPANNFETFVDKINECSYTKRHTTTNEICHETYRKISQDNIDKEYYNIQTQLEAKEQELERFQEIFEEPMTMSNKFKAGEGISKTEAEINTLSVELKQLDKKINFATIHIELSCKEN